MNTKEIIEELRSTLQNLEDAKVQITEQQESIRELIANMMMAEVDA